MNYKERFNRGLDKSSERIGELFGWALNGAFLYVGIIFARWIFELF